MSITDKIDVLELLINFLRENDTKLESLIERLEIGDQTFINDSRLGKILNECDSSNLEETRVQNILVVDDDRNLATSFKLILESSGCNVDTAATGLQALYKLSRKNYELVLLDLNLPDIMGVEVAEEIEARYIQTDIVFITGYSTLKEEVESHLDAKEILMKPITLEVLLETLTKKLAPKKPS